MDKQDYRKAALARRDAIPKIDRERYSRMIIDKLLESKELNDADSVLVYCSYLSEVDTHTLIERLLYKGKRVYCPKVTDPKNGIMEFYEVRGMKDLTEGYHGIPEPVTTDRYVTGEAMHDLDSNHTDMLHTDTLMILPGVAFDRDCNRIGYRGGFYDRYIPRIPGAYLIALAFEEQISEDIFPMESHDIKPDAIYTQARIIGHEFIK
ncbi:5-formyltetrahydrofolate cyclo-ligase [Butyrivibrio sp. TB]|uniref:5-formyltetrahydrofolate cyclo-ligase n=1 Tax=Butyrivibrio sp. TB TaxID=1520809 RepID=UPI0008B1CAAD|nr:5-formyltetrahydrofolate cyclo-ligase [Butyrivibrio sp. TB]SEP81066.1 5-formyltetrahydrofolate cyclo-ligase [Butyrivibrio sp. TB]